MTMQTDKPTADQLARAGTRAIETYFRDRKTEPITAGDGRFSVFIPGGEATETLQLALASTPASRGVLARVKARRTVALDDIPRALLLVNHWNRSNPLPHVALATRGDGTDTVGHLLVEALLPASPDIAEDLVANFIDAVVAGGRQFWSGKAIAAVTSPMPQKP